MVLLSRAGLARTGRASVDPRKELPAGHWCRRESTPTESFQKLINPFSYGRVTKDLMGERHLRSWILAPLDGDSDSFAYNLGFGTTLFFGHPLQRSLEVFRQINRRFSHAIHFTIRDV